MYSVFGLRDPDYSNMIIEGIKFIVVITVKYVYKVMDVEGLKITTGPRD